jgi:predicted transposase/invertase (TIGR01784 family)
MKTDSLFYRLFQTYPATLFELLGQPGETANFYKFSSVEVKQLAFRIDGVFASNSPTMPTYFVEVQFQADAQFYNRTITEIFLYLSQNHSEQSWNFVVLFAKRSIAPQLPAAYQVLSPQIQLIFLDELPYLESQPLGVKIVDLVVCKPKEAQAKLGSLLSEARSLQDLSLQTTMLDLIETILVYKFEKLSRKEIEAMFGLSEFKKPKKKAFNWGDKKAYN